MNIILRSIVASAFLFSLDVSAQSRSFDCVGNKNASKSTLVEVQSRYQSLNSVEATFEQESYLASLDVSEISQGNVYFEKPGKMRWDYKDPEVQSFLLSNGIAYFYQPDEKQLIIDKLTDVLITDVPVSFIMGLGNLDKDFNLVSSCAGSTGEVLTLKPKSKKTDGEVTLKELKLLVRQGDSFPAGGRVVDSSGNVTSVLFRQPKVNSVIRKEIFSTDFPKGIDVHDRRVKKDGDN